jgi:tetratricopeptide (TPR) repeat protein
MVLSPWADPIPFTRAWCLFEIYCTEVTGSFFEVAMSAHEQDSFLIAMCENAEVFFGMLAAIDVENSQAWNPEDLKRIFKVVADEVGFSKLNSKVKAKMREWVDATLKESLGAVGRDNEEQVRIKLSYATTLCATARWDEALDLYEQCLTVCKEVDGEHGLSVAAIYNNKALVYQSKGESGDCLDLFQAALNIRRRALGPRHRLVADTLNNIGIEFRRQGRFADALSVYDEALQIRLLMAGEMAISTTRENSLSPAEEHDQLSVADSFHNIGIVYDAKGAYERAIKNYQRALDIRISILGKNHLDVAVSLNNLATVYESQVPDKKNV